MNEIKRTIQDCRSLMRAFIEGSFDYGKFRQRMAEVMGPLDPLDWVLEGLSEDDQAPGARDSLKTNERACGTWL